MRHTRLLAEHHQCAAARSVDPPLPTAIRWLARLCLERPTIGFGDLAHLLAAFEALPTKPTYAWSALTAICARHRSRGPGVPI